MSDTNGSIKRDLIGKGVRLRGEGAEKGRLDRIEEVMMRKSRKRPENESLRGRVAVVTVQAAARDAPSQPS
jgi:hypothetical protein